MPTPCACVLSTAPSGIPFARALPEVAVRDPVNKSSADLPQALRDILDKTDVGHLTPPEQTTEGVQMFAVCSKKESKTDSPGLKQVRDAMFDQEIRRQGQALSCGFAAPGDDRIQIGIEFSVKHDPFGNLASPPQRAWQRRESGTFPDHACRRKIVQPLALTLGEPAGIGPDLALAIWRRRAELDMPAILYRRRSRLSRPTRRPARPRRCRSRS